MLSSCEITRLYLMAHKHVALIKKSGLLSLCKYTESRLGFLTAAEGCVCVCVCLSVFEFIVRASVSPL